MSTTDYIKRYLSEADGITGIMISDREGVPLVKVTLTGVSDPSMKPQTACTFAQALEQSMKLGLGPAKSFVSKYENMTIVQLNQPPLVVTVIGRPGCNVGAMLALEDDLHDVLKDMKLIAK